MESLDAGLEVLKVLPAKLGGASVAKQRAQPLDRRVGLKVDAQEPVPGLGEVEQVEPDVQRVPRARGKVHDRHLSLFFFFLFERAVNIPDTRIGINQQRRGWDRWPLSLK